MDAQDLGVFTRADYHGVYAKGDVDGEERIIGAWYTNSTVTVPLISSVENIGTGLVLHFAARLGKIFIRFEA